MENDFNSFSPYMNYGSIQKQNDDFNNMYSDPTAFNPIVQYEQACSYYKFLCKQMDYKIKCKEYEKLCGKKANEGVSSSNTGSSSTNNSRPR